MNRLIKERREGIDMIGLGMYIAVGIILGVLVCIYFQLVQIGEELKKR